MQFFDEALQAHTPKLMLFARTMTYEQTRRGMLIFWVWSNTSALDT